MLFTTHSHPILVDHHHPGIYLITLYWVLNQMWSIPFSYQSHKCHIIPKKWWTFLKRCANYTSMSWKWRIPHIMSTWNTIAEGNNVKRGKDLHQGQQKPYRDHSISDHGCNDVCGIENELRPLSLIRRYDQLQRAREKWMVAQSIRSGLCRKACSHFYRIWIECNCSHVSPKVHPFNGRWDRKEVRMEMFYGMIGNSTKGAEIDFWKLTPAGVTLEWGNVLGFLTRATECPVRTSRACSEQQAWQIC